ncbi:hypothetical protein TELCIR_21727 [Teladorsagia circumcincta]|uniref:Uncharacterized protein n=1 Tax=Teladorsagia circumcincta TaxID=45464 RepID=A0A2G9TH68_TELCI|nr:hypothetical protein TELCIR_21727 [Teladorsagia circumcincta]
MQQLFPLKNGLNVGQISRQIFDQNEKVHGVKYECVSTPGRHRTFSGNPQSISNPEDGCPVQVKIAKSDDDMEGGMAPTVQFRETNEYPVVFKWHCSATR